MLRQLSLQLLALRAWPGAAAPLTSAAGAAARAAAPDPLHSTLQLVLGAAGKQLHTSALQLDSSPDAASSKQPVRAALEPHDTASIPPIGSPSPPRTLLDAGDASTAAANAPLLSSQFPSSADDAFGIQRNWFTALYKQLNYMAKTGSVPTLKDRQRLVFEQVSCC
jgi:hypothetical protein